MKNSTHKTIEAARKRAAQNQKRETNTAGWWKIRDDGDSYYVYYDSARQRDGVNDDEHADIMEKE